MRYRGFDRLEKYIDDNEEVIAREIVADRISCGLARTPKDMELWICALDPDVREEFVYGVLDLVQMLIISGYLTVHMEVNNEIKKAFVSYWTNEERSEDTGISIGLGNDDVFAVIDLHDRLYTGDKP